MAGDACRVHAGNFPIAQNAAGRPVKGDALKK